MMLKTDSEQRRRIWLKIAGLIIAIVSVLLLRPLFSLPLYRFQFTLLAAAMIVLFFNRLAYQGESKILTILSFFLGGVGFFALIFHQSLLARLVFPFYLALSGLYLIYADYRRKAGKS